MTIQDILKDSDYSLDLLSKYENDLEITTKEQKNGKVKEVCSKFMQTRQGCKPHTLNLKEKKALFKI